MQCIPELVGFPNFDQIPPNLEPQPCTFTMNGNSLVVEDVDGNIIFDGPLLINVLDPFAQTAAMSLSPPQQLHELELQAAQKGGEVIYASPDLTIVKIPATVDEFETIMTYNPEHANLLSHVQLDENKNIATSMYYRYNLANGIPQLANITERVNFKVDGYDVPLIKKNYYNFHTYQFDVNP